MIQTNRDQLQLEDDRLVEFLQWGRKRVDWALTRHQAARQKGVEDSSTDPAMTDLVKDFT